MSEPDLNKYDWGTACRYFIGFKDSPGAIRLAWEICELYREEYGCAYPTRETLSQNLKAPPESVSKWLRILENASAIEMVSLNSLPVEIRSKIGRSAKRSQVYKINFKWAASVLNYRAENIEEAKNLASMVDNQKVTTPLPLNPKGNDTVMPKGNGSVMPKGNGSVNSEGGDTVTLIPYNHTLDHTLNNIGSEVERLASTRETVATNAYALARGKVA